ncbi:hypothetical protein LUX57_52590 [Actinomadura madurae]|uniref:hypothetical protein n=1 Tax=Actinomadura madurae TaxID=1993 RepID=UPI0020D20539|nr:hypothetical protein [Actinomadura madurae]MCP9972659.1 hypothetical protein [Actinomadura madurae]
MDARDPGTEIIPVRRSGPTIHAPMFPIPANRTRPAAGSTETTPTAPPRVADIRRWTWRRTSPGLGGAASCAALTASHAARAASGPCRAVAEQRVDRAVGQARRVRVARTPPRPRSSR